jgi:hypothetical protein
MDPEKYLLKRTVCSRRGQPHMPRVEQSARSCMNAWQLMNREPKKFRTGLASYTGLRLDASLAECRDCPQGRKLIEWYEGRWGKYDPPRPDMAEVKHKMNAVRREQDLATPDTNVHLIAMSGIPTCI